VARVAAIQAGLPIESVAMSVNRLCSSGLQAIVTTAQNILLGDCDYGVGGAHPSFRGDLRTQAREMRIL
jgi:acetyl-CoA C-acetyltransferase